MYEIIKKCTKIDISKMDEKDIIKAAKKIGVGVDSSMGKGKLIEEIFSGKKGSSYFKLSN